MSKECEVSKMRPIFINPVLCGHIKTPQSESCLTVHNLKNVEKLASHFQHYFANSCSDTLFPGAGNRPHEFLKQPPFAPKHPESQHQLPERQKRHHGDRYPQDGERKYRMGDQSFSQPVHEVSLTPSSRHPVPGANLEGAFVA